MENNYLCLNGNKIELTAEQVAKIKESFGCKTKLSDKEVGDIVTIGDIEFIVLEHSKETTALLMKDLLAEDEKFGDSADFKTSNVKKILDKFADDLAKTVGEENIIEHTVDLTSCDGLKDYRTVRAKASLLTCDLYRRYVETIDKHKLDKWWWLATPYSAPTHGYEKLVSCVAPSGRVNFNFNCNDNCGVRPFCILKSDIFVS